MGERRRFIVLAGGVHVRIVVGVHEAARPPNPELACQPGPHVAPPRERKLRRELVWEARGAAGDQALS